MLGRFIPGLRLLAAVGLVLTACIAHAQNAIESLNVSQQGASVILKINLRNAPASPPAGFIVANPPRVALDFPNTVNALGRNSQDVGQGELRSINVVQVGERSRLVLNLKSAVTYDTKVDGKSVLITLAAAASAGGPSPATPTAFAEARPSDGRSALRDIDFRRAPDGSGRVIVELANSNTGVDIRQQGQSLVVEFQKSQLPDNLRRRLDVGDFATPVQTINTFVQGDNVRMVIEPKGMWEHNAYQSDTQFVVEVKPIKEDPNKLVQGSRGGYNGEKLSLNFQNIEVRAVLQVIADFTNLNIITSDTVGGNLTLRLKDVPWDQALDIILQTRGLDMRKNGNVIWIAPRDELATKEKLDLEQRVQISDLEPTRTESFQLNYQKAVDVRTLLADPTQKILSKRGSAVVDARTNQLFVQDTPTRLDEVRRLIGKIDIPVRQVLIEARIVEASDTFSKNLGARLGTGNTAFVAGRAQQPGSGVLGNSGVRFGLTGNYLGVGEQVGQAAVTGTSYIPNTQNVSMPAQGINGINAGSLAISLFTNSLSRFINLELSALEAEGKGKIISAPRVLTADQIEATIEQGTELPYQQATSSGATSVTFRKANLSLKVKPQITPEGNIIMDVQVNKDSVGQITTAGFAIDTKNVKTQVLVDNGGTVVIGGIYTQNERDSLTKVPFFGDLPVFGNLFRNSQRQNDKTELLVFITPRVVSDRLTVR
ncbi:MAG: type IV pilus secretin PilQ [Burkholderiales bacterium]|nr:type IV pilus secretin PilQ [Burkholderiales bacterium]